MALAVGGGANKEPPEHGVTAVPLFGMDRGSPSVLGKGCEFCFPLRCGFLVVLRGNDVQAAGRQYSQCRDKKIGKNKKLIIATKSLTQ